MGKLYTTDGKILSDGFPQIQVGDKLYRVDNRKSTYDAIQKEVKKAKDDASADEILLKLTLGEEQLKEIKALDLSVAGTLNLMIYIQAAMFDITYEEAQARFQKSQQ